MTEAHPPLASAPKADTDLGHLFSDLAGMLTDRVHLLTLELQRAGKVMVLVVALAAAAVLFAFTAWLALWVGLVLLAMQAGLALGGSVALVLLLNGVACVVVLMRARTALPKLLLPATMRRLTRQPAPSVGPQLNVQTP